MIVVGNKWTWEDLVSVPVSCPKCGKAPTTLCFGRNRATVYYVPVFTFKQSYALFCQTCDGHYVVEESEAKALLSGTSTPAALQAEVPSATQARFAPPALLAKGHAPPVSASATACEACGQAASPQAKFCSGCGRALTTAPAMCRSCGEELTGRFCGQCGTAASEASAATATVRRAGSTAGAGS